LAISTSYRGNRLCALDVSSRMAACTTVDAVRDLLADVAVELGFRHFLYGGRFMVDLGHHVDRIVSNYPPAWLQMYQKMDYVAVDPIVKHALEHVAPVIWSDRLFVTAAERRMRAHAASFGLVHGASFPMHSRYGDVSVLSLVLQRDEPGASEHLRAHLPWGSFWLRRC
jgi:LuxR family transcriptional regulator, quorum-sensing system regulator LasR